MSCVFPFGGGGVFCRLHVPRGFLFQERPMASRTCSSSPLIPFVSRAALWAGLVRTAGCAMMSFALLVLKPCRACALRTCVRACVRAAVLLLLPLAGWGRISSTRCRVSRLCQPDAEGDWDPSAPPGEESSGRSSIFGGRWSMFDVRTCVGMCVRTCVLDVCLIVLGFFLSPGRALAEKSRSFWPNVFRFEDGKICPTCPTRPACPTGL